MYIFALLCLSCTLCTYWLLSTFCFSAEVEVMKRRSHAMDTDSVDFGGEVKGHVTAVTAAPTDIKRLETKVRHQLSNYPGLLFNTT